MEDYYGVAQYFGTICSALGTFFTLRGPLGVQFCGLLEEPEIEEIQDPQGAYKNAPQKVPKARKKTQKRAKSQQNMAKYCATLFSDAPHSKRLYN